MNNKFKLLKQVALAGVIALAGISTAQAGTYHYENTPAATSSMSQYSTTWNEGSETLNIKAAWDDSKGVVDRVAFLISDGGSPWKTPGEQFLWYDLDLSTSVVKVKNYFAWNGHGRLTQTLDTFTGPAEGVVSTANSINLTLDHTFLNGLSFAGLDYKGAGFTDKDIGIWYYMYSNGRHVETLDIHHGKPSVVPVPAAAFLFAPALAGFAAMRRKLVTAKS